MISVVVYGRNDSHGYNLHKRAVLSLNSLAMALTDTDDEIVFVDWNSDPWLPPFPVAVGDLLSREARDRLRIIRVPRRVHERVAGEQRNRSTIEPIARNAAIRRANPNNKWILSTNTDILLLNKVEALSKIASELSPGYYGAPRFELPEWIWESLARFDPEGTQRQIHELTQALPLRREVRTYPYARFDAPGDFQLIHRESFESIGCFDESMTRGWHVDSNAAKRLNMLFGETRSISSKVEVYHCNHTREQTHFHSSVSQANDLHEYVWNCASTVAKSGTEQWGLRGVNLESLTLDDYGKNHRALIKQLSSFQNGIQPYDFSADVDRLCGTDVRGSLAAILDVFAVTTSETYVSYIGARPEMSNALQGALDQIVHARFFDPASVLEFGEDPSREEWIVIDLTPPQANSERNCERIHQLSPEDKVALLDVLEKVDVLVRALNARDSNSVGFLIMNAEANELERCIEPAFSMMPVQFYSRVRRANLRRIPRLTRDSAIQVVRIVLSRWVIKFLFLINSYLKRFRAWRVRKGKEVNRRKWVWPSSLQKGFWHVVFAIKKTLRRPIGRLGAKARANSTGGIIIPPELLQFRRANIS